jgi:DNA-binding IclR family transcriptional regulator
VAALHEATGESAQLYVRRAETRVCVASAERERGLRDTVPMGAVLPLTAGSAAHVLLAFETQLPDAVPAGAAFDAELLERVRLQGWSESVGEREPGVASVSAPVKNRNDVVAALSLSGPIERLTHAPGRLYARQVMSAAARLGGETANASVAPQRAATMATPVSRPSRDN